MIDIERSGVITPSQALTTIRLLGIVLSESMEKEIRASAYGITFQRICDIVAASLSERDFDSHVKRTYLLLKDEWSKGITKHQLITMLNKLGIELEPLLLTDLFEQMAGDEGEIITEDDFVNFIKQNGDYVFY
eukprot:MONOS_4853.1-p1 / transcript=MONOS_4853.1 / gene=MONOS_4853 / organism=Monocercomonoides_exilis_PA203 / gene_product=unspecified product / transcript_product=unspecified product / location=Mono_scaffold00135:52870-53434(+) / protein_length=133 / sequence_SO=supercontig / SO=protein_coding / is_pseudo=false